MFLFRIQTLLVCHAVVAVSRFDVLCVATEMRPAELFFQMHLLARESKSAPNSTSNIEYCQSPERWVLRAIHTNPSCVRYWKVLQKLIVYDV